MRIALASDHAGYGYKEAIKRHLQSLKHEVEDFGTFSTDPVDYPDFIRPAAMAVACGECERAIVLGGSGNGEAIVANRVPGVRCAIAWSLKSAELSRKHNDANALSLGQRMLDLPTTLEIVDLWLTTPFEGERHQRRIEKIDKPQP